MSVRIYRREDEEAEAVESASLPLPQRADPTTIAVVSCADDWGEGASVFSACCGAAARRAFVRDITYYAPGRSVRSDLCVRVTSANIKRTVAVVEVCQAHTHRSLLLALASFCAAVFVCPSAATEPADEAAWLESLMRTAVAFQCPLCVVLPSQSHHHAAALEAAARAHDSKGCLVRVVQAEAPPPGVPLEEALCAEEHAEQHLAAQLMAFALEATATVARAAKGQPRTHAERREDIINAALKRLDHYARKFSHERGDADSAPQ